MVPWSEPRIHSCLVETVRCQSVTSNESTDGVSSRGRCGLSSSGKTFARVADGSVVDSRAESRRDLQVREKVKRAISSGRGSHGAHMGGPAWSNLAAENAVVADET